MGWRRSRAWRIAAAMAVLFAPLAAAAATVSTAAAAPTPETATVFLPATTNPPGADTGIDVDPGSTIELSTSGIAYYGVEGDCNGNYAYYPTNPVGDRPGCGPKPDPNAFDPAVPIGYDLAKTTCDSSYTPVGSGTSFMSVNGGDLQLLYNDVPGEYGDNGGGYTVQVTVEPPPVGYTAPAPCNPLTVDSGQDQTVYVTGGNIQPDQATLDGTVTGGVPTVSTDWSVGSTPPDAEQPTIAGPSSLSTTASFTTPGDYTVDLTATDAEGLTAESDPKITVCPDVYLISAQGALQSAGVPRQLQPFVTAFKQNFSPASAVQVQPVQYSSLNLGQLVLGLANVPGAFQAPAGAYNIASSAVPGYDAEISAGVSAVQAQLSSDAQRCPQSEIYLLGFSQGANVMQDVPSGAPGMGQVVEEFLYGDPQFDPAFAGDTTGTAGVPSDAGPIPYEGLLRAAPFASTPTIQSTCHSLDVVCQGFFIPPGPMSGQLKASFLSAEAAAGLYVHLQTYQPDAASDGANAAPLTVAQTTVATVRTPRTARLVADDTTDPPGVPTDFTSSTSAGELTFTWSPPSSGQPDDYVLSEASSGLPVLYLPGDQTSVTIPVPAAGSGFEFDLAAITDSVIGPATSGEGQTGPAPVASGTPTVTSTDTSSGPTDGGTTVTVFGTGYTSGSTVSFGTTPAAAVTVVSPTLLQAISPPGSGTVDIEVTSDGGTSDASPADEFTYTGTLPQATGVSPAYGPTAGGTTVVIDGANFTPSSTVTFDGTAAQSVVYVSPTQLQAVSPSGAGTGDIEVTTGVGTSGDGPADLYSWVAKPPTVSGLTVTVGPAAGGSVVTVEGTGFTPDGTVAFGGAPAAQVQWIGPDQVEAVAPPGSGTVDVQVTADGGTSAPSAPDQFTYLAPPTVTGIDPTGGPTSGGTTVVVTGSGFTSESTVTFAGVAAPSVTVESPTELEATAPAGGGTAAVQVASTDGQSSATPSDDYTFGAGPEISQVVPPLGLTAGGSTVTLDGTGFTPGTAVTFGGTAALTTTYVSSTQLRVTTPPFGAGGVPVSASNPLGTSPSIPAADYLYLPAGDIDTVAGNGHTNGDTGDSSPPTYAELDKPSGMVVDGAGDVFVADQAGDVVREISAATGEITTYAGDGTAGDTGDGGPATSASLDGPVGLALAPDGTLYISEPGADVVRAVAPGGTISTVAGTYQDRGDSGDGGLATAALLGAPWGLAVAPDGTVFIADQADSVIRAIAPGGTISTVAGNGTGGFDGDGPALESELDQPEGLCYDAQSGTVVVADTGNNRVRALAGWQTPRTATLTTVAGDGTDGAPTAGPATSSALESPAWVAEDGAGDLYVSAEEVDEVTPAWRKTDGTLAVYAGDGTIGFGGDDGPATAASLDDPAGLATDTGGDLFIADEGNNRVREVFVVPAVPGPAPALAEGSSASFAGAIGALLAGGAVVLWYRRQRPPGTTAAT